MPLLDGQGTLSQQDAVRTVTYNGGVSHVGSWGKYTSGRSHSEDLVPELRTSLVCSRSKNT